MHIEVVSENAYARKIHVKVPGQRVRDAFDKALAVAGRRASLPGFRPGKVPRQVLEQRFGESILGDVAGELIQVGWRAAIDEHKLEPVAQPSVVEQGDVKPGVDFTFVIGVEVKPAVTLGTHEGLEVYWPKAEVEEAEVEEVLAREREGQARLVAVTDRPVQVGDSVQVELLGKEGDDIVLQEPGTQVQTVGETWLAGLGSFFLGMSIGETKEGDVVFSPESRNEAVRGRGLKVKATLLGIQALEAPALSDELAKELGHESLEAWRASVRSTLASGRDEGSKNQARANLLEKLIEANPFDVPQGMVDHNLSLLVDELRQQQARLGRDPKDLRLGQKQLADLRRRALFAARGGLLLEAVWTAQGIEATEADLDDRLRQLAESIGQSVEQVRSWFSSDDGLADFRGRIREEKTLDWLLSKSKISHEAPSVAVEAQDEAPAVEPAAGEASAKPKRAAKKKAEAAPELEAASVEAAPVEAAPKPRRASKKKAEDAG